MQAPLKKITTLIFFSYLLLPEIGFSQKPKLVVGIVVDQMRYDFLTRFENKFGNKGFKRLINDGFSCKETHFNYVPTFTAPGHTSIYTGTTPSIHGIVGNTWYNKKRWRNQYCVADDSTSSVGTAENTGKMSPKFLESSTLGDELKSLNPQAKVFGIALKDRAAILPAGKTPNAAFWLDAKSGHFISSSYYLKILPAWLDKFNALNLPETFLKKNWNTLLPLEQYTESDKDDNPWENASNLKDKPVFPYSFTKNIEKKNYEVICTTPFGNSLTLELAKALLEGENLGKDSITDLLCVSLSSTDYIGHDFGPNSIEIEDTYLRLDIDLANFLTYLDEKIGKDKYLIFLTSDHGVAENPERLTAHHRAGGKVDGMILALGLKHALQESFHAALLQTSLNDQIFLNDSEIVKNKLNKYEVEKFCQQWLLNQPAVSSATCIDDLLLQNPIPGTLASSLILGYNRDRSGDVLITYKPSFINYPEKGTTHGSGYNYDTHVPLIFFGMNVKAGATSEKIYITDIAPTISEMIKIPRPDGCRGLPIEAVLRQ